MKRTTYSLSLIAMAAMTVFSSFDNGHFLKDATYRLQVEKDLQVKKKALPRGNLFSILNNKSLTTNEKEALQFLYAYLPTCDITDHSGNYFLENVRLSEQARREMPWGNKVPDDLYRHFVLPIRVNNENLDDSRKVFFNELKDRVKGLSMKEAILEVNHWCHEKVVYTPSDARTSSPLASVRTAYGRCGEESTFTVAALRAVGIPARQIYTPRWAHTDDNHAWVEAWADGKWYFFGACEPEPVLNLGWFNTPASRAMLTHTNVFGRYVGPEEVVRHTANFTEINVIGNYATPAKSYIQVVDANGRPVSNARVEFKIYNYAEFYTAASKYTDNKGMTFLTSGKGDMLIWASKDDKYNYGKLSFGKQDTLKLVLTRTGNESYTQDFDIVPPPEHPNIPDVTPEQRAENTRRMAQEDAIRNAYVATMFDQKKADAWVEQHFGNTDAETKKTLGEFLVKARGNHAVITGFLLASHGGNSASTAKVQKAIALLKHLSDKDLRDISLDVLNDNLENTPANKGLTEEEYAAYLLTPRVEVEMLTPYKKTLQAAMKREGVKDIPDLINWCKKNIRIDDVNNRINYVESPLGVWNARVADARARDVFFVSAARSLGLPARIDGVTGKLQYLTSDKTMHDVVFDQSQATTVQPKTGTLKMTYTPTSLLKDPNYYTHFTISKFKDGCFSLLSYNEGDVDMGGGTSWSTLFKNGQPLDEGYYMLVTGNRLANGSVLSQTTFFTIRPNETTTIPLVMREDKNQVQVIGSFNSETKYQLLDKKTTESFLETCGRGYFVIGILGPKQEPTNHALRDISLLKEQFEKWGRKLVFLFPSEEERQRFHASEFPDLPSTVTYGIDVNGAVQKQIMENMQIDEATLPIFIIADTFNHIVFLSKGYTIGLGEQLMKSIHGLQ